MYDRSGQLLGIILDMRLHVDSICTVELKTPSALPSDGLFVIKFCAIHHIMGSDELRKTFGQSSHPKVK